MGKVKKYLAEKHYIIWFLIVKIKLTNPAEAETLLTAADYAKLLKAWLFKNIQ